MIKPSGLHFVLFLSSIPFFITGFIGNVLVIHIVHKTREMHTPTNYLLANMAVSDAVRDWTKSIGRGGLEQKGGGS